MHLILKDDAAFLRLAAAIAHINYLWHVSTTNNKAKVKP
jgi:hypothetical protein